MYFTVISSVTFLNFSNFLRLMQVNSFNIVLRDLLKCKSDRSPIGKVESASSIVQRFCTGGMTLGAISRE